MSVGMSMCVGGVSVGVLMWGVSVWGWWVSVGMSVCVGCQCVGWLSVGMLIVWDVSGYLVCAGCPCGGVGGCWVHQRACRVGVSMWGGWMSGSGFANVCGRGVSMCLMCRCGVGGCLGVVCQCVCTWSVNVFDVSVWGGWMSGYASV